MPRSLRSVVPVLVAIFLFPCVFAAGSGPLLHPLFSDHAVLQQGQLVPVWGWADAGTKVTVRFADQTKVTTAMPDGRWTCSLQPLDAASHGRTLVVTTDQPGLNAEAKDVLVGEVWLCSGQSNMEMGITLCDEDEEIEAADHPSIRLLTIPHKTAYEPMPTFEADWKRCSPDALRSGGWGGFSATAYFFGKKLHQELGIPIGLIHSSWGGTQAEAWTSKPALVPFPSFGPELAEVAAVANSTAANPEQAYLDDWFQTHDPGTRQEWHAGEADTSTWRRVQLPGRWGDCGIPGFEGVVWAQRHIEVPDDWANQKLIVQLGEISDNDTAWLSGRVIGRTIGFGKPREYVIPPGIAKPGSNVITLRITNAGGGSILADHQPLQIHPLGRPEVAITLAGAWSMQETSRKADTGRPLIGNPRVPSVLYNGMIAPLQPAALAGVTWYQGEANASRAHQYKRLLPALIRDWRKHFRHDDLAFHIVSLANFQKADEQPRDDRWAELREAQAMTAKAVPHCGLAIAIDIGDADDIHPKNKREVGRRLALSALAKTYKKPISGSGPWFRSVTVEENRIRIHFDHTHGGLVFKGKTDRSFAVAAQDRKFFWAEALIDGDSIVVSVPSVTEPVAVRYAWGSNPQACLYNGAGLPAVPFRSDSWPVITENR